MSYHSYTVQLLSLYINTAWLTSSVVLLSLTASDRSLVQVQVQVTLRLTVCQSVSLGVEPPLLLNIMVLFSVGRPL
jgi:hypothetical protein